MTITDANACVLTQTFTLTEPTPLHVVSISSPLHHGYNISCNGGDDGSISLSVAGGVSPYTFCGIRRYNSEYRYPESRNIYSANSWCKQCINNPLHYSYSTWTGVIWFGSDRGVEMEKHYLLQLFWWLCKQQCKWRVAPYTYSWNTGQTTGNLSGVIARNYSLIVTDQNGCQK